MTATGGFGRMLFAGLVILAVSRASGFEVTLDAGVGSLTILDNDGNDLNPEPDVIDFSATVAGILLADGRVEQFVGPIARGVLIGTRTPGGEGIFRNLDSAAQAFAVRVEGDSFAPPGPALGWVLFATALGDDATLASDVEIPTNGITLRIDPGDTALSTLSLPIATPVDPGAQPVLLSDGIRAVDPAGDATRVRVDWSFTPGPFDELRLPDQGGSADAAIVASVFNAQDKCVYRMNKDASAVAKSGAQDDLSCLKQAAKLGGGDASACVDDRDTVKQSRAEVRLLLDFSLTCSVPPAFAANVGTCCEGGLLDGVACMDDGGCPGGTCTPGACISGAAETANNAIIHDVFGPAVLVSGDSLTGKCQQKVMKSVAATHDTRWKLLVACKRANISTFATEADFVATCLGPPQPDPVGRIAKAAIVIDKAVAKACVAKGVTGLGTVFPGVCATESDVDYAACLAHRVACRFCQEATVADDVLSPLDCDLADDGSANGSCP